MTPPGPQPFVRAGSLIAGYGRYKRWYILQDFKEERGNHALKTQNTVVKVTYGAVRLKIDEGWAEETRVIDLTPRSPPYLIPAGWWRTIKPLTPTATAVFFVDTEYNESDYIRDRDTFERWSGATL